MERIIAKPMVNSFCLHFIPNSLENNFILMMLLTAKRFICKKKFFVDHPGLENKGKDCWVQCLGQQGPCPQFCGTGMCCRYGYEDTSGGCDGSIGLMGMGHICWADPNYKEEDTGNDSYFQNHYFDILYYFYL